VSERRGERERGERRKEKGEKNFDDGKEILLPLLAPHSSLLAPLFSPRQTVHRPASPSSPDLPGLGLLGGIGNILNPLARLKENVVARAEAAALKNKKDKKAADKKLLVLFCYILFLLSYSITAMYGRSDTSLSPYTIYDMQTMLVSSLTGAPSQAAAELKGEVPMPWPR